MKSTILRSLRTAMLLIGTVVLLAPGTARADASLLIDDLFTPDPNLKFSWAGFNSFTVVGGGRTESGKSGSVADLPEFNLAGPITYVFNGDWTLTAAISAVTNTVVFLEGFGTTGVSDILTYSYTQTDTTGHLTGSFVSDSDPGGNLSLPTAPRILFNEYNGFYRFNNQNITASAISDVPEPSSLLIAGAGICAGLAYGWTRHRRDRRRQRPVGQTDTIE